FEAIPSTAALTDAGTDIGVNPHTNTLTITATDTDDNDHNADGNYVDGPSTADAYIARADLVLDKTGIGGVTDSTAFGSLPDGTWIAGQGATTGYDQPQWQITITNEGPDEAFGP